MITKEIIQLMDTELRGKFMKIPNLGIREKGHDSSCCDKKHFLGGFFCPEMLELYFGGKETQNLQKEVELTIIFFLFLVIF